MTQINELFNHPNELAKYPFIEDLKKQPFTNSDFKSFKETFELFQNDASFRLAIGLKKQKLTDFDLLTVVHHYRKPRREFLKRSAGLLLSLLPSPSFAESTRSAKDIIRVFEQYKELKIVNKQTVNDSTAPTIIIVEDLHRGEDSEEGWQTEFRQLELIRKNTGINFVGIEGWAGKEADDRRKRRITNAEQLLIDKLTTDKNYTVIGLEEDHLQLLMLNSLLFLSFLHLKTLKSILLKLTGKNDYFNHATTKYFQIFERYQKTKNVSLYNRECDDLIELAHKRYPSTAFGSYLVLLFGKLEDSCRFSFELHQVRPNLDTLQKIESVLSKRLSHLFPDHQSKKFESEFYPFQSESQLQYQREVMAINLFFSSLNKYGKTQGIIVFGKNHTKNLVNLLNKVFNNRVNIIVVI